MMRHLLLVLDNQRISWQWPSPLSHGIVSGMMQAADEPGRRTTLALALPAGTGIEADQEPHDGCELPLIHKLNRMLQSEQ